MTAKQIACLVWDDWRADRDLRRLINILHDVPRRTMEQRKEQAFARALAKAANARKAAWALNWRLLCRLLRSHPGFRVLAYWAPISILALATGPNAPHWSTMSAAGWCAAAALAGWPLIPILITAWTMRGQHTEDAS